MRVLLRCALFLLLAAAAGGAQSRVLVDRIVTAVNGDAILASDWDEAVRFQAFLEMRPLEEMTELQRAAVLERLIDQKLLLQQVVEGERVEVSEEAVSEHLQETRREHPAGGDDARWQAALAAYGLSEERLAERLRASMEALRFVELRLRPNIHIEREEVETYYREQLAPEVLQRGQQPQPLAEVAGRIEALLAERRLNELLESWLRSLREQSEIRIR
jgi:parvulin-like peptidyl-prolyl isomerase